jgi:hypothetical protein
VPGALAGGASLPSADGLVCWPPQALRTMATVRGSTGSQYVRLLTRFMWFLLSETSGRDARSALW